MSSSVLVMVAEPSLVPSCSAPPWGQLYHEGQPLYQMVRAFQRCLAPAWSSPKSLLFPPLFYQRFLSKFGAPVTACDLYTFIHSVSLQP